MRWKVLLADRKNTPQAAPTGYAAAAWSDQFQSPTPPARGIDGLVGRIQAGAASGGRPRPAPAGMTYVVLQIILKQKLWGTGSGNLTELEKAINAQAALGYRLHTISTAASGS